MCSANNSFSTWERGRALRIEGHAAEAVQFLRRAVLHEPDDERLHDELGAALCELNRHEEGIGSFLNAVRLNADFDEAYFKIGSAFAARGMLAPALHWFHRAREINPASTKYLGAYGRLLVTAGCIQLAAEVFDQWTKAEPDNPIARYLAVAVLGSEESTKAPADYVQSLFDGCATRFDEMVTKLKYCGPKLVVDALQQVSAAPQDGWEVVDVGCGTGLVGVELRPLARRLVGVDLSARMLEMARQREVYDELIEAELIDFLGGQSSSFDVLTASDVLSYLGDLAEFFQSVARVLRPGGIAVVVLEALEGGGNYRLSATGRFSHSPTYLRYEIERSGLSVAHLREDVMRHEASKPVATLVAAVRKPPADKSGRAERSSLP
jgi:predicted TPR repeat methyltransferase